MDFDRLAVTPWSSNALCRLHVLCAFLTARLPWGDGAGRQVHLVQWGLGWVANGECEQLGAWVEPADTSEGYAWTVAHLLGRGLDRILLVTGDNQKRSDRIAAALSDVPAYVAIAGLAPEGLPVLWRRMSASRMRDVEEFRVRLNRAIRRHGTFGDEEQATGFVAKKLQREERRLNRAHADECARRRLPPAN
jgi:hypothetical protein